MQNGVNAECWLLSVYVMVFSARWCRAILMRAYFLYVEGVGGGGLVKVGTTFCWSPTLFVIML